MTVNIKVFCLHQEQLPLAQNIANALGQAEVWLKGRDGESVKTALRQAFLADEAIIALVASGIIIRSIADLLTDKHKEPPVIAVAADGSSVVPLLGGHHGANDLAQKLAKRIDGHTALTTAGDLLWGIALDSPPKGWAWVNPPSDVQAFMMQLNQTRAVRIKYAVDCPWLIQSTLPLAENAKLHISVGLTKPDNIDPSHLWLVPQCLAVGMGCERGCESQHLRSLLFKTLDEFSLPIQAIYNLFSIDVKTNEPALKQIGFTPKFFSAPQLNAQQKRLLNPSSVVFKEVGVWGVAEGAALAAAGPDSDLVVPKQKNSKATIAIAVSQGHKPLMSTHAKPQGQMLILGLGPGDPGWRAAIADSRIAQATDLVGYHYYIDQVGHIGDHQTRHDFSLGEEEKRCAYALDLAAQGKSVVLLCSGDPGVYAMGAPLFELMDRLSDEKPQWGQIHVEVIPGITAMMAAAAKLGAPLGHDFCAISLSDLLTPRDTILNRIQAAAKGDFVISFYNPVSQRRRELLDIARDALLKERPSDTPVVICRQVGRAEESFDHVTLGTLRTEDVDMWCLVLVGSRQSRYTSPDSNGHRWLYTPRGYAQKKTVV